MKPILLVADTLCIKIPFVELSGYSTLTRATDQNHNKYFSLYTSAKFK